MLDLFKTMLTPTWIVSVLFVGLVINVVSGYLKDGTDKVLEIFFKRAKESGSRRARARIALIAKLRASSAFRRQYRTKRLLDACRASVAAFTGLTMLILSVAPPLTLGTGAWWDIPPSPGIRFIQSIVSIVFITVAEGYGMAAFQKSIRLIEAEEAPESVRPERERVPTNT